MIIWSAMFLHTGRALQSEPLSLRHQCHGTARSENFNPPEEYFEKKYNMSQFRDTVTWCYNLDFPQSILRGNVTCPSFEILFRDTVTWCHNLDFPQSILRRNITCPSFEILSLMLQPWFSAKAGQKLRLLNTSSYYTLSPIDTYTP